MSHISYDPSIIKTFATRLYEKADGLVRANTVLGVLLGLAFGAGAGGALGSAAAGAVVGAVVGGVVGYLVGQYLAFKLRLQAQIALCQVQIEENTRTAAAAARTVAVPGSQTRPAAPTRPEEDRLKLDREMGSPPQRGSELKQGALTAVAEPRCLSERAALELRERGCLSRRSGFLVRITHTRLRR